MKRIWAISSIIFAVAFLSIMHKGINAVDLWGAYDKAKAKVQSASASVQNAANSAKGALNQVKENVSSAASAAMQYFGGSGEPTAVKISPYKNTVAQVRIGNQLNTYEREFLQKRQPKVKQSLEKTLNRSLDGKRVPNISVVASGGGYRAMLGTLGGLLGLEKIGVLGGATYMVGLSGSTWAISSWLSTGMSLPNVKSYIQKTIEKDIRVYDIREAKNIIDMLGVKTLFDEPITTVDIYGALLANRLFTHYGTDAQRVYLSQQAERIKNGDVPYPIYTAIDAREAIAKEPHWFEYTPHEIGSPYFGVYVPTWAYGRSFNNGKSIDFAPEQTLGFLMGTWGSAYGTHVGRAWEEIESLIPGTTLKGIIEKKLIDPLTGKRVTGSWGEIFNFMYGIGGQELSARKTIKFVDAGIDFNLPYPPISGERPERKADIMIFLDFSGGSLIQSMKKIEAYAQRKGLKFPKIDYTALETKAMSVFMDQSDPSVPVVIYFPRISEKGLWEKHKSNEAVSAYRSIEGFDFDVCTNDSAGFCGTLSFQYSPKQSSQLIDQMEFNIMIHKDKIIETINKVIDRY